MLRQRYVRPSCKTPPRIAWIGASIGRAQGRSLPLTVDVPTRTYSPLRGRQGATTASGSSTGRGWKTSKPGRRRGRRPRSRVWRSKARGTARKGTEAKWHKHAEATDAGLAGPIRGGKIAPSTTHTLRVRRLTARWQRRVRRRGERRGRVG